MSSAQHNPRLYKPTWESAQRILAVRLDNIGDVIMLGPALRTIKQTLPGAHLTLLASPGGSQAAPLLPWIDEVISWRAVWQDISGDRSTNPARELELVELLRSRRFDAALIFTSFSQSPYPPASICYLAGIPLRVGQSKEFGGRLLSLWVRPPGDEGHQVDRNLHLIEQAGFQIDDRSLELGIPEKSQEQAEGMLRSVGIDPLEPFIVAAPGASCASRRYAGQHFAAAVLSLADRSGFPIVIVGSPQEAELLAPVSAVSNLRNKVFSFIGQTTVPELAGIIRRCTLLVANNSAALHIADAFRRPMVILYSGTDYETQWKPRSAPAHLLRRETACSPCYRFHCPYQMECLDIPAEEVAQAAMDMLSVTMTIGSSAVKPGARIEMEGKIG